jgi:DNA-binding LytR/AlgR family response regulator
MRAMIVDDERPARLRLRRLLGAHGDVEVVAEAADAPGARALLATHPVDVLFLDVQMPGESGFELLASLARKPPVVVFVTAFDAYAVRAFEEEALDYLLKPFRAERLSSSLERARATLARQGSGEAEERLERVLHRLEELTGRGAAAGAEAPPAARGLPHVDRLSARVGDRIDVLRVRDVLFFRAENKYVVAYTAAGSHVLTRTLDQLETELDPQRFARVHRSVIVSLDAVASVEAEFAGTYVIRLRGRPEVELPVSRQRAKALRERLRF